MPEFNQANFSKVRKAKRELDEEVKRFETTYYKYDGTFIAPFDLVNDFGRDANYLFEQAKNVEDQAENILNNARISAKKKREYEEIRQSSREIKNDVQQKYNEEINENTMLGNDSRADAEMLEDFTINK